MNSNNDGPTVTLRLHSRTLSVAELSEKLNAAPTEAHDIGTPLSKSPTSQRTRSETLWLYEFRCPADCELEDCIDKSLQFLEKKMEVISALRTEVSIDLFCGCRIDVSKPAMCLSFDCKLIQRLAALRLDVMIDVIPANHS